VWTWGGKVESLNEEEEEFTAKEQRARTRSTKFKARIPKRKKSAVNGQ
jgi:hypothetical protein